PASSRPPLHAALPIFPLEERRARVRRALERLDEHRDLLTLLLVWEIGKPWGQAATGVDRTISGVEWYCDEIEVMLTGRRPLPGPDRKSTRLNSSHVKS